MSSPTKVAFARGFVFAFGGALIVMPLHPQQGDALGEDAEAMTPTRVTGSVIYAPRPCTQPDAEQDGAVLRLRNRVCSPMRWTSNDPRLGGSVTLVESEDVYQTDDGVVSVTSVAEFVSNDEGGWVCSGGALERTSLRHAHPTDPRRRDPCTGRDHHPPDDSSQGEVAMA